MHIPCLNQNSFLHHITSILQNLFVFQLIDFEMTRILLHFECISRIHSFQRPKIFEEKRTKRNLNADHLSPKEFSTILEFKHHHLSFNISFTISFYYYYIFFSRSLFFIYFFSFHFPFFLDFLWNFLFHFFHFSLHLSLHNSFHHTTNLCPLNRRNGSKPNSFTSWPTTKRWRSHSLHISYEIRFQISSRRPSDYSYFSYSSNDDDCLSWNVKYGHVSLFFELGS